MTNRDTPLLVANWKANLAPAEEVALAGQIATEATRRETRPGSLMIAPSTLGAVPVASLLAREHGSLQIGIAAQDVSALEPGAHTGEGPAPHLLGVARAVILGHSERRDLGETGALIGRRLRARLRLGSRRSSASATVTERRRPSNGATRCVRSGTSSWRAPCNLAAALRH